MRDNVVSPRFTEDSYKGQDIVHRGVRIPLSIKPEEAAKSFSRRAQRIISHQQVGLFRTATDEDLPALRALWFDPMDQTFPDVLGKHVGIVGLDADGTVIAGAVWAPAGSSLFLHQLVAGPRGKELDMPTRLVWESVNAYHGKYFSLDIGVSYNPKRYEFFKNFAVRTYPIILKKPFYVPVIRMAPFRSIEPLNFDADHDIDEWKKCNMTFFPRASYALYGVLKHLKVGEGDLVCIIKTFGSDFISGCVTQAIEKTGAKWMLRQPGAAEQSRVKAVIAVHEFGLPIFQEADVKFLIEAQKVGVPIIEDCAWRTECVFPWSDYQVFSLQKMLNINYGAMLKGVYLDDEFMWSIGCLDTFKRERARFEKDQGVGVKKREDNWYHYDNLVKENGMEPDDCLDYRKAIIDGWVPTVYLQKFESDEIADAIVARLEEFGIQAGRYWGEPVVYLPIHQNMTSEEVEYMFAVVAGYFNLCRDYK